mmetsp:Transcript_28677/g.27576  ORF Transcript_28677/g.27576 Transcript_28677/m.27576 type:complete len:361 (+) Transcript_28677:1566-2648(+)
MCIQQQLCESSACQGIPSTDTSNINSRTSRIITKLFARVIKAEEQSSDAYFRNDVDVESILMSMSSDFFSKPISSDHENFKPCQSMARVLILSIIKAAKRQQCIPKLEDMVENLTTNNENSQIFELLKSCSSEIGVYISEQRKVSSSHIDTHIRDIEYSRAILPQLVSSIGETADDNKRNKAVADLGYYVSKYGEKDLLCHLETVSVPFKDYILAQLQSHHSTGLGNPHQNPSYTTHEPRSSPDNGISMSEKLRYLKSKLHATEAAVHSAFNSNNDKISAMSNKADSIGYSAASTESNGTISSIREKLATANQQRALRRAGSTNKLSDPDMTPSASSSALGSAAALRARLQEVKRNKYTD